MILPVMILSVIPPFALPTIVADPVAHVWQSAEGQTAQSTAGQVGQRRTREDVAQDSGVVATSRIGNRIQNRIHTRIYNRIDRYYTPQADAASPFADAEEQTRAAGRPRR